MKGNKRKKTTQTSDGDNVTIIRLNQYLCNVVCVSLLCSFV